jgi:hypothetical protein
MAIDLCKYFKNGHNFKFKEIDCSHSNYQKRMYRVKKQEEEIEKATRVTLEDMRKITFTI